MKKIIFLLLSFASLCSYAQEDAWVYFNDKPSASLYLNNPTLMLTQRALDRRIAQNIALQVNDVPVEQSYIDQITASNGITVKAKSKWLNCLHVRGAIADITALTALPFVHHVYFANTALNAKTNSIPLSVAVNKQFEIASNFNYGNAANQIQMLNGHLLHQQNYTGSGKIIAVLDSGFTSANTIVPLQRLFTNNLYLGGYNFVARNTDVFSTHSHGTMTLSCMVGYVDGQLVGTAPDASYYLFITEDVASENPVEESYWVEAAEEADRLGVDIISTSLGYFTYDNGAYSHTYSEMTGDLAFASKGANIAFSKGMIVVASAGNSGASANPYVGVPAEATHVLAVGAVKADKTYASFSSIGPSFDNRVKPDVMAQGQSSVLSNTSGIITTASGTSFSCPIMAGAIACFWQALPSLTNQQIIDFVKQSSDRYANPNAQFGYGIPDFSLALSMANLTQNGNVVGNSFTIYPNPVKKECFILAPDGFQKGTLAIINALGQLVLEKDIDPVTSSFSLEGFESGVYWYKIASNSMVQTGKLIKE